jgi:hypothetical protein
VRTCVECLGTRESNKDAVLFRRKNVLASGRYQTGMGEIWREC